MKGDGMVGKPISREEALLISRGILEKAEAERSSPGSVDNPREEDLEFGAYQEWARTTAIYPNVGNNIDYPTLGLCSEIGEVAGKVKKIHRDSGGVITPEIANAVGKELGDVIWYIAAICWELGLDMSAVAKENMDKLNSRLDRGTLGGSGDNR